MKSSVVSEPITDKNLDALRTLLDDDDPAAIRLIEEAFQSRGESGTAALESVIARSSGRARKNAEAILLSVKRTLALPRFEEFCATGDDLETGAFLLAQTQYPLLTVESYQRQLDEWADGMRPGIAADDPRKTVESINAHLFGKLRFRGNTENYYDPDNSFLHRVLDRRLGIPISLSVLYLLLGQRLALPLAGVGMPGHFIIKWEDEHDASREFYIDPFSQGRILTAEDCADFLKRSGFGFSPQMLATVNARHILARMCNNLVGVYRQADDADKAARYESFAVQLSR